MAPKRMNVEVMHRAGAHLSIVFAFPALFRATTPDMNIVGVTSEHIHEP
jgi:hypothetical protein